ncbi:MAG: hypothetical protein NZT92_01650 [Abditibacteriales bacterium]|nr:hypothetical protein [Abditibacteriales bacterium]MDW8364973.1 hypothetical protein [Abditibacteriales bacterium]
MNIPRSRQSGRRLQRGAALGFTLTVVLIVSVIIATVIPFTFSHLSLAHVDKRYADALFLAEAGVNYKIQEMNRNVQQYPPPLASRTITFDSNRSVTVWAEATSYAVFRITAIGNSQGVQRTVRVKVAGRPSFIGEPVGVWALMGIHSITISGHVVVQGERPIGTSGTATISPNVQLNGNLYLAGSGATTNYTPRNNEIIKQFPLAITYPTTVQLMSQLGVSQSRNDNQYMVYSDGVTPVSLSSDYILDMQEFNADPNKTIILKNPGLGRMANFYVKGVQGPQSGGGQNSPTLKIDNTNGAVALWIDNASSPTLPADLTNINIVSNNVSDPFQWRIYFSGNSQTDTLSLSLVSNTIGYVYAVPGKVTLEGNGNFKGSIIASHIHILQNANITFPFTQSPPGSLLPEPGSPDPVIPQGEPIGYYNSWEWQESNPR